MSHTDEWAQVNSTENVAESREDFVVLSVALEMFVPMLVAFRLVSHHVMILDPLLLLARSRKLWVYHILYMTQFIRRFDSFACSCYWKSRSLNITTSSHDQRLHTVSRAFWVNKNVHARWLCTKMRTEGAIFDNGDSATLCKHFLLFPAFGAS